jgi:hypothetical protein
LIAILALHRRDYGLEHKIPDSPSGGGAGLGLDLFKAVQKPPSAERLKLQDPNLIQPLEWILLRLNDGDYTNPHWKHELVKTALPYTNIPKQAEPPPSFDFSNLRTAEQMMAAQRTVMKSVGEGRTTPQTAKTIIESLSLMTRCLDTTVLEDRAWLGRP